MGKIALDFEVRCNLHNGQGDHKGRRITRAQSQRSLYGGSGDLLSTLRGSFGRLSPLNPDV